MLRALDAVFINTWTFLILISSVIVQKCTIKHLICLWNIGQIVFSLFKYVSQLLEGCFCNCVQSGFYNIAAVLKFMRYSGNYCEVARHLTESQNWVLVLFYLCVSFFPGWGLLVKQFSKDALLQRMSSAYTYLAYFSLNAFSITISSLISSYTCNSSAGHSLAFFL